MNEQTRSELEKIAAGTDDHLTATLDTAIAALAEAAGEAASSVAKCSAARDFAEAAERLASARALVTAPVKRERSGKAMAV